MTFCLDTTIITPENNNQIKNAIILLHGYGGDGKDISLLTLNWKRFLPNTIFLCPNGHEACPINPSGFQWFDLSKDDPDHILEGTYKAEKKIQQFKKFRIDKKLMSFAKRDCIFLHCLPRGSEVSDEIFLGNKSHVWQQALNRVHVQKSILLYCFGKLR